jgi:iron complex outermembrane receptor protein
MSAHRVRALALSISVILYGASAGASSALASPEQPSHAGAALAAGQKADPAADPSPSKKPKPKQVTDLNAISVKSRFVSLRGHSALKMNVAARDTPFSISTYTGSFMHAVEAQKVDELYPYMTGIQSAGTTGYDMVFRGFTSGGTDINSILVDGLPGLPTRFGSPPTIGIERIDVVRGPSSVLNGQEQPGGFINLVTKKPEEDPLYEFNETVTAYGGAGIGPTDKFGLDSSADLTGPIGRSKNFLYRLVLDDANKNTYRNASYDHSIYFAPSLTWKISDATSLTAAYVYQRLRYSYDTYLVAPDNNIDLVAPITTRYQQPNDRAKENGSVVSLFLTHHFDNDVTWNVNMRDVWHRDDVFGTDPVNVLPDLQTLSRRAKHQVNNERYGFVDTNLQLPLDTFGIEHKMVLGLTAGQNTSTYDRLQFFNAPTKGPTSLDINLYDPVYTSAPPLSSLPLVAGKNPSLLNDRYAVQDNYAAYLADVMTLSPHWKSTVGLRYTTNKQSTWDLKFSNVPKSHKTDSKALPMLGLIYQPNEHWSYYTSYSTSFIPPPSEAIDTHGVNSFVPTSAGQVELGSKANFLHNRISADLAVYRILEKNTLSTFKCEPYGLCYGQIGKARSQGAEFEVNARPVPNWQLTAGYAYTDARVTGSDNAAQINSRLPNVPFNSAHIWSRYDFLTSRLQGLGFGLGVIYNGERNGLTPTSRTAPMLRLPAYTRVDAALYYSYRQYVATFKVENLFDTTYYQSAGSRGAMSILPGAPRQFTLSVRAFFD